MFYASPSFCSYEINSGTNIDYNNMTTTELKAVAKEKNIVGYSKMSKKELIKILTSEPIE